MLESGSLQQDVQTGYYASQRLEMFVYIPSEAQTILEVGCGEGYFAQALKKHKQSLELWGVELNEGAAKRANKHFSQMRIGSIVNVLPDLPNSYFDCIVCNDILEHLEDPYSVLLALKEKLKSSGKLVLSLPNVRYIKNFIEFVFLKDWQYQDDGILDRTHLRFFTQKSIVKTLSDLKFRIERIEGINPTQKKYFGIFNLLTFFFFRDTRYMNFACVCSCDS